MDCGLLEQNPQADGTYGVRSNCCLHRSKIRVRSTELLRVPNVTWYGCCRKQPDTWTLYRVLSCICCKWTECGTRRWQPGQPARAVSYYVKAEKTGKEGTTTSRNGRGASVSCVADARQVCCGILRGRRSQSSKRTYIVLKAGPLRLRCLTPCGGHAPDRAAFQHDGPCGLAPCTDHTDSHCPATDDGEHLRFLPIIRSITAHLKQCDPPQPPVFFFTL